MEIVYYNPETDDLYIVGRVVFWPFAELCATTGFDIFWVDEHILQKNFIKLGEL